MAPLGCVADFGRLRPIYVLKRVDNSGNVGLN